MSSITDARTRAAEGLPVEDRRLQVGGIPTAVLEGGDGPPIVLLHGPIANGLHWRRVIPMLTARHRVVVPDLPGQGETGQTAGGTREDVLDWLDALVERTCDGPATVAGVTLGGAVAAWYAAEHPERVDRLVLVDALGLAPFTPAPRFGAALNSFLAGPGGETYDALWDVCAFDFDPMRAAMGEEWEALRAYAVALIDDPRTMAGLGALMQAFALQAIPDGVLAGIDAPTTLVWGRQDLATTLVTAEAASARYGWSLEVIDDCADEPPMERPAAVAAALERALDRMEVAR
jgi:pimeloyl-ACP methyl ester carboxylesterase